MNANRPDLEKMVVIAPGDEAYPDSLSSLQEERPEKLFCIGDLRLLQEPCAAVVGSRKATSYGKWAAYQAGKILAEYGIVTVSGMAYGCDAEAHKGALDSGGKTIAVLAGGADVCYPPAHYALYRRIIENGLIISENPPGTPPLRRLFPKRNRIISGLSALVAVTEAGVRSGSLITAGQALEQGKEVMAFPGNITSEASRGCNLLIRDGAAPVTEPEDLILQLGLQLRTAEERTDPPLNSEEAAILRIIREEIRTTPDRISEKSGLDISRVNAVVSILEIKDLAIRSGDRITVAKKGRE